MKRFFAALAAFVIGVSILAGCALHFSPESEAAQPQPDFTSVPQSTQQPALPAQGTARQEYRAMWISYLEWPMFRTADAESFTQSVSSVLENCASVGVSRVIVQVRPFGDAIYPSEIYPWSHLVTGVQGKDPGYDPLAIFVQLAHERGMAIEAWVNPYRVRLNDRMPPSELAPENPALTHPERVREANGGLYFDPALPEVQELVVCGVQEILEHYDVDGIQFDDYFYPTTEERFDAESYARYGGGKPLDEWRRENVNSLVRKVYDAVKAAKPDVIFGISPQGNNDNNYYMQYSDVGFWMSQPGYVDYVMPQVYWGNDFQLKNGSDRFAFGKITDEWLAMPRDPSVKLYFGLGAYRIGAGDGSSKESEEWQSGENLARMAAQLEEKNADGWALYRYENLFGGGEFADLARQECAALAAQN